MGCCSGISYAAGSLLSVQAIFPVFTCVCTDYYRNFPLVKLFSDQTRIFYLLCRHAVSGLSYGGASGMVCLVCHSSYTKI